MDLKIKKMRSSDIPAKIEQLDKIINDSNTSLDAIKIAVRELRAIVNHTHLIYNTSRDMLERNIDKLNEKIYDISNASDEDEYGQAWIKFMNKQYDIDDIKSGITCAENTPPYIEIFPNLKIKPNNIIKIDGNNITCTISSDLILTTTKMEIENIIFEYSSDIIRDKNKKKRHIGPVNKLSVDLPRLVNNKLLFKEEKNKIKTSIIYNIILYLLLSDT